MLFESKHPGRRHSPSEFADGRKLEAREFMHPTTGLWHEPSSMDARLSQLNAFAEVQPEYQQLPSSMLARVPKFLAMLSVQPWTAAGVHVAARTGHLVEFRFHGQVILLTLGVTVLGS